MMRYYDTCTRGWQRLRGACLLLFRLLREQPPAQKYHTVSQAVTRGTGNSARDYALSRGENHACLAFAQARLAFLRALLPDGLSTKVFGCLADGGAARAPLEVVAGKQVLVLLRF